MNAAAVISERIVHDAVITARVDIDAAPLQAVPHLAVTLEPVAGDQRILA
jgi:hypothetical protein